MGKNCAIAIGINHYYNLTPLQYAQQDAEAMRDFCQADLQVDPVYFLPKVQPQFPQPKALRCSRNQHLAIWNGFSGCDLRRNS